MDDVFAYIEAERGRFVDELRRLLAQPSISTQDRGVRECAALVERYMRAAGIEARQIDTAGYPVLYAPNESITLEGFVNGIRTTAAALFELAAA